jgi:hypothetical protein
VGIATEPSFQTTSFSRRFGTPTCPIVGAVFDGFVQVQPIAIEAFNQFEFPVSFPYFDLRFAADSFWHGGVVFVPNQFIALVVGRKTFEEFFFVGGDAIIEIACNACVYRASIAASDDVDGGLLFNEHCSAGFQIARRCLTFGMTV